MQYKVIGLMSGSSLDGLDIAYIHFLEQSGTWHFDLQITECLPYEKKWFEKLQKATQLSTYDYLHLDKEYGGYLGESVANFITKHNLAYQVDFIVSHGHTTFHNPREGVTAQLGNGATLAAKTGLPVINDLRSMDVAYTGEGAPIVPIGEKNLFKDIDFFLNIGGITNISADTPDSYIAFDISPANSLLNFFANQQGLSMDTNGAIARTGKINNPLLDNLTRLPYYTTSYPKSLSNQWATDNILPLIQKSALSIPDILATLTELISGEVVKNITQIIQKENFHKEQYILMITGGGAFNTYLMERIRNQLPTHISIFLPEPKLIKFKEVLIIGFMGVLRWRTQRNVLSSVTGATRDSINGCLWWADKENIF